MMVIGLFVVLFSCGGGCSVISYTNDFQRAENGIKTQYKANQSSYATYFNKIKEMAQVPGMYTEDLSKVYEGAIKGRYGSDGSKAMFNFIKEHNPNFDSSLYVQLQRAMEAGRDSFNADQKLLLDKKQSYDNQRTVFPGSLIASLFAYPKINLDEFDIVINAETEDAFKTKKAAPIQVR